MLIKRFHSRDKQPYGFTLSKDNGYVKEFKSRKTDSVHNYSGCFVVLKHQYGRRFFVLEH